MICVALPCVFLAASASSADHGLRSYVEKLNRQTAKAYVTKDSAFFDRLFGPGFESRDERGVVMKRKESLFVVRFQLNTIKVLNYKATTQALKLEPARGTVVTQAKMIGLTQARHGRPAEKITISRRWSDVYQRQGKDWALVSRTELAAPVVVTTPLVDLKPAKKK